MSDYKCAARTSYFKVKDVDTLQEITKKLGAQVWEQEINGETHYAFGNFNHITDYYDENSGEPDNIVDITPQLQKIIEDDEVVIIQEAGHDELKYVMGFAYIITKDKIEILNLPDIAMNRAKELVGNKHIQLTY